MKVRTLGLLTVVASLAAVPVADAGSPRDRATGGGQLLIDPNSPPETGALDTLAFTAQNRDGGDETLATGQVQVNRRSGDSEVTKFHGVVECLVVRGDTAYISGEARDGAPFELYVVDGGAGVQERVGDQGMLWYGPETGENDPDQIETTGPLPEESLCGIEEDPDDGSDKTPALARGNYQVHDAP